MRKIIPVLLSVLIACCSCNNETTKTENTGDINPKDLIDKPIEKIVYEDLRTGEILEMRCKEDPSKSYMLYLPSKYSSNETWPVIYVFDAHARGKLAIEKFREIAVKLHYVIVASNDSQNGVPLEVGQDIYQKILADTKKRININGNRVYTAGFSGGARQAVAIALEIGGVKGVIGCGAGFPGKIEGVPGGFFFIGIAGDGDFNYSELKLLNNSLLNSTFFNKFIVFDGKHDWPPAPVLEEAVWYFESQAMKKNLIPQNDSLLDLITANHETRIKQAGKSKDLLLQYDLYLNLIDHLSGIRKDSIYRKGLNDLVQSTAFKTAIGKQQKVMENEKSEQVRFSQSILDSKYDKNWWSGEVSQINKQIKNGKDKYEIAKDKRLLGFLSILAFTHADNALSSSQLGHAGRFLDVYYFADPENPDCSYLWGCFHALKGNSESAFGVLEIAINHGFTDLAKLESDGRLQSLRNDERYNKLVEMIKTKAK